MDNNTIRVAITHGDTNGVGYELIFRTFEAQEILELCTPIVYGSPKVAAFHRNALQSQTAYTIINEAKEAKDGRLNLLATFPEEVKVELGTPTEESNAAAQKALAKAKEDFQQKAFDVLVTAPTAKNTTKAPLPMLVNDRLRIALATTGLPLKDVPQAITQELIEEKPCCCTAHSAATSASRNRASPSSPSTHRPVRRRRRPSSPPSRHCRRKK